MAGINIPIGANANEAVRAARQAGDAIESIGDTLADVARDSQRSGDRAGSALADGIRDGARDAGRATERLGDNIGDGVRDGVRQADRQLDNLTDSFRDAVRASERSTSGLGSSIGTNVQEGTDEAREGLREVGDEAAGTAKETAASFDGSAESITGAFQEIAANAFAGFGPAGLAAGLAAAAGIGLIMAQVEAGKEETEAFKARVGELAQEFIETGDIGQSSIKFVVDELKRLATTTEEGVTSLKELQDAAKTAGSNVKDISQAYAGNTKELGKVVDAQEKYLEQLEAELEATNQNAPAAFKAANEKVVAQQLIVDKLHESETAAQGAAEQERAYLASGAPEMEAKAAHIEAINEAYDEAAEGAEDYIDKESGIFDVQGFIDAMATREQALLDYENTLATTNLTPQAKAYIESQGVESAATFLAGYKTATPAQQAELNRIWTEAGKTSSGSFSGATKAELRQAGYEANVKLNPDTSAIRNYLNTTKTQDVLLRVQNRIDLPARSGMGVP